MSLLLNIASALIFFWICMNNIDISLKCFAQKVDLSELTISKLSKEFNATIREFQKHF